MKGKKRKRGGVPVKGGKGGEKERHLLGFCGKRGDNDQSLDFREKRKEKRKTFPSAWLKWLSEGKGHA